MKEVADGVFVHFGTHEDANRSNKGDIANIGFILGKKSIMVIDTGGTKVIGKKLLEKIKTISIIDHWIDYKVRFIKNKKNI